MPGVKTLFWLLGLALLLPPCAQAQVQVNPAALRQLQGLPPERPAPPAPRPAALAPRAYRPARHHDYTKPLHRAEDLSLPLPPPPRLPQSQAVPTQAPIPPHPPAMPAHPTPDVPLHRPVSPPLVVKLDFAPNSAILPAGAAATLKPFCTAKGQVPILAHAPSMPDNPGMAMQLSMQRAFAIRAALIACGVPAQNIIPQSTDGVSGADGNEALVGAHVRP